MINNILALQTALQKEKKITIVGHKNPDGDAIGSCLAWYLFLKKLGHKVHIVMPNAYPDFLHWVPQQDKIVLYSQNPLKVKNIIAETEIICTLDFNNLSRVGVDFQKDLESSTSNFVMIDHHQQPDNYADIVFSYPKHSSTAELVYTIIKKLGQIDLIDQDIASCLYLGIMTDTGSFKYSSTTATTHHTVADLIEKGAKSYQIQRLTFDSSSYSRIKLLGKSIENLKYLKVFNTAYIHLSQEELDTYNFQAGDTEGFVNYGLSIKDVVLAAFFKEDKSLGIIKISFRSKGDFDVNQFAKKYFNGGGHKNAAGGSSSDNLKKTIQKFVNLLHDYKKYLQDAI